MRLNSVPETTLALQIELLERFMLPRRVGCE